MQDRSNVLTAAPSARTWAIQALVCFAAYVICFYVSEVFETTDMRATPWNPETGIAFICGLLVGWPAVPTIALANGLANAGWGPSLSPFALAIFAFGHALVFCAPAALIRKRPVAFLNLTVKATCTFIGLAAVLALVSITVRFTIGMMVSNLSMANLASYALVNTVGNLAGMLTVVPCYLATMARKNPRDMIRSWRAIDILAVLSVAAASFFVFALESTDEFKFFYVVFLPVIILSLRHGYQGAALSVMLTSLLMLAILAYRGFAASTVLELQALMITLAATGLIVGAAVSERVEANLALEQSQLDLLRASRLSLASEMASALAHDLNQPLSATRSHVRSAHRRLGRGDGDTSKVIPDLEAAVRQIDVASGLVKSSRQFLSRGELEKELVDPAALVEATIRLVRNEFENAGVEISASSLNALPPIYGRLVQLQQVLLNLLRNAKESIAIGATSEKRVFIGLTAEPDVVRFSICDTGSGVPESIRDRLFSPLQSEKQDGLGLGLSLCQTIINKHGGSIWLEAESSEFTTCFCFTVPLAEKRS